MKKFLILILSLLIFSCAKKKDNNCSRVHFENIPVRIAHISKAKYTKVIGYVTIQGMQFCVTNGNSGYYYKKYRLSPGQIIYEDFDLNKCVDTGIYGHTDRITYTLSDLNVSRFELK